MDIIEQKGNWKLIYSQFSFDYKYKVYDKTNKLYTLVSFQFITEAYNYFNKVTAE